MKTALKLIIAALIAAIPATVSVDVNVDFGRTTCETVVVKDEEQLKR